jgi:hypothetical protein
MGIDDGFNGQALIVGQARREVQHHRLTVGTAGEMGGPCAQNGARRRSHFLKVVGA